MALIEDSHASDDPPVRPRFKNRGGRGGRGVGWMTQLAYRSHPLYAGEQAEHDQARHEYIFGITFIHSTAPLESLGSQGLCAGSSGALADMECVHGRLPGDPCPQPSVRCEVGSKALGIPRGGLMPRLWTAPYPCKCWGEPRAVQTPDLLAKMAGATFSHESGPKPVDVPRSHMKEAENGRKPVDHRSRCGSPEARVGA